MYKKILENIKTLLYALGVRGDWIDDHFGSSFDVNFIRPTTFFRFFLLETPPPKLSSGLSKKTNRGESNVNY